jgi:hypothetical protein
LGNSGYEFDWATSCESVVVGACRVPAYPVKAENGRVFVNLDAGSKRQKAPHEPHPLARRVERAEEPLRLAGISTSAMDAANPRFTGSDHLFDHPDGREGSDGPGLRCFGALGPRHYYLNANPMGRRIIALFQNG